MSPRGLARDMNQTGIRRSALVVAALLSATAPLHAQVVASGPDPDVVDRVVAIVGDSAVLMTQVLEQIEQMRLQNPSSVPSAPGPEMVALQKSVLNDMVDRLIVLRAAGKDTLVKVDDDRVEQVVNQELDQRQTQFPGGRTAMLEALQKEGMTLAQYREILTAQVRESQLQQMYVQRQVQNAAPVDVSEDELRAAFADSPAGQTQRPKLLTFQQVVIAPTPSDSEMAAAKQKAQTIVDSIRAGADFEEMAQRYSQDPGSAEKGGDLDWFRRGQMVREFEDVAFALHDGQVSDPVKTEFGYHIIKIERSRMGERKGRHILIRPELGPEDVTRARARADSVVVKAKAGTPMQELFDDYSDPTAPDTLTVAADQLEQLPPGYNVLKTATEGQVIGPVEYDTGRGETRLAVVRIKQVREAGTYTFDDVKAQLAQQLQQKKQVEKLIEGLRGKTHVELLM